MTANATLKPTINSTNHQKKLEKTTQLLSMSGIDDQTLLVGDTFFFKEGVSVLYDGKKIDTNITIKNLSDADISNVASVKLKTAGSYTYSYSTSYNGETFSQERTIKAVNPSGIIAQVTEANTNNISLNYKITNPYTIDSHIFLEDWALFKPNETVFLGNLTPKKTQSFNYDLKVVPVFNYLTKENNGHAEGDPDSSLYKGILYTEDGQLAFLPTVYYKDNNNQKLSTSSASTSIDMSHLIAAVKKNNESLLSAEILIEQKDYHVGDDATIVYKFKNQSAISYNASIEDWVFFGISFAAELGEIKPHNTSYFTKKVTLTAEMLTNTKQLISAPAIHFYQAATQKMVIKKDMDYVISQPVTVNYLDSENTSIHEPTTLNGSIGTTYDASTADYKLALDGYELDETNLPDNALGFIDNEAKTVTYTYKKIDTSTEPSGTSGTSDTSGTSGTSDTS